MDAYLQIDVATYDIYLFKRNRRKTADFILAFIQHQTISIRVFLYREIGVIVVNMSDVPFVIRDGERIAQLVVARHETVAWKPVAALDETIRGAGGFGHTGRE